MAEATLRSDGGSSGDFALSGMSLEELVQGLDRGEDQERLARARQLWLRAREGAELGAVDAVLAAVPREPLDVAFVASLARRHHARRTGAPLPRLAPLPPTAGLDVSGTSRWRSMGGTMSCAWRSAAPARPTVAPSPWEAPRVCGVCASERTRCLESAGVEHVTGTWWRWQLECAECGCATTYAIDR